MLLLRVVLFSSVALPVVAWTQAPTAPDSVQTAAEHAYSAKQWPEAEAQYSVLTRQQPENARFWYRLAIAARAQEHYDSALDAMRKAKTMSAGKGLPGFMADYEIATIYAAKGDSAHALETLKSSADGGFSQPNRLTDDREWNSLRENQEFVALARQVQHNAAPCEDPEFKQFDFWVGDWDVASAVDNTHQGSSHVAKEMGGCVIWENWTSDGMPYFGKSYNTWNVNLKRWEQYWVDNAAGVIFFHGGLKDDVMDYWTDDVPQPSGGTLRRHLQFYNLAPGKVRQFSQGSTDNGKSWHVEYDLVYSRRSSTTAQSSGK